MSKVCRIGPHRRASASSLRRWPPALLPSAAPAPFVPAGHVASAWWSPRAASWCGPSHLNHPSSAAPHAGEERSAAYLLPKPRPTLLPAATSPCSFESTSSRTSPPPPPTSARATTTSEIPSAVPKWARRRVAAAAPGSLSRRPSFRADLRGVLVICFFQSAGGAAEEEGGRWRRVLRTRRREGGRKENMTRVTWW
ncbi:uncharacterized protein A4U43_C01F14870 [Asparagus officinalis]|uniref:Uncharacterized protein n=1 Tax=Asparagus officinalis TaxID=4686 RepID=A0A5P1FRX4_ASPOF|nr:uncharacterized protein A4U43_C01F14870 [Asparagus officinalis]